VRLSSWADFVCRLAATPIFLGIKAKDCRLNWSCNSQIDGQIDRGSTHNGTHKNIINFAVIDTSPGAFVSGSYLDNKKSQHRVLA
jgi:hypothetical protein